MRPRLFCLVLMVAACLVSSVHLSAQPSLPLSHPKVQTAQRVFDDLVRAFGDGRTPPQLHLLPRTVSTSVRLAFFNPQQHRIILEERAYDLCVGLGADSLNALAFLLGHELAHYYENHGWVADFGNDLADLAVGQTLKAVGHTDDQLLLVETEADHLGGFYGYVAGYRSLDVAPILLERIYQAYGLDKDLAGYPALAERQIIARRAAEDLQGLIPIFDGGHRALLLLEYETAARCFEYVGRKFPSREILNNAAVARALQARTKFAEEELKGLYPFEVDSRSRLAGGKKAGEYQSDRARIEHRTNLLLQARKNLERAQQKDPAYPSTFINLACVTDLLGQPDEAALFAQRALKIARLTEAPLAEAHALLVRGIVRLHGTPPDTLGSRGDFKAAQASAPVLARANLALLGAEETESKKSQKQTRSNPLERVERIGGLAVKDFQQADLVEVARVPRDGMGQPTFVFFRQQARQWEWFVLNTGYNVLVCLTTQSNYSGTTERGVQLGDAQAQVEAAYGPADYQILGPREVHHVYAEIGLVVGYGAEQKVKAWMLFHMDE